jgi:hypothetical protein
MRAHGSRRLRALAPLLLVTFVTIPLGGCLLPPPPFAHGHHGHRDRGYHRGHDHHDHKWGHDGRRWDDDRGRGHGRRGR